MAAQALQNSANERAVLAYRLEGMMNWIGKSGALACLLGCLLGSQLASAMVVFRRADVLIIHGTYAVGDESRLRDALTPGVTTVILRGGPGGGSFSRGLELAQIIEKARVTTVVHGPCTGLICPMMFLAGKERQFSGETRAEASYVRLQVGNGIFPDTAGEDRGESWNTVMSWWHNHSSLTYAMLSPQHQPLLQNGNTDLESKLIFHPDAKTVNGTVMHCWGKQQTVPYCEVVGATDALQLGIITRRERYQSSLLRERADTGVPPPVAEGNIATPPGVAVSDECNRLYADFLRVDSPRAFVISESGGCNFRSAQHIRPHAEAIEACRKRNSGSECRFYVVDTDYVFVDFAQAQAPDRPRRSDSDD